MLLERCPWYIAGPILAALIIGLRASVNKPLGALGGYIDVANHAMRPWRLGFSACVLAGIAIGGMSFTLVTGTLLPATLYRGLLPGDSFLQGVILGVAGIVMGVGARTAGGCTSGHGLAGMSLGSPASIVAAMTFFASAVAFCHLLTWLIGSSS